MTQLPRPDSILTVRGFSGGRSVVFGMRRNVDLKRECSGNGQSASLDERMIHSVIAKLTAAGWKEDLLPMKDLQPHPLSELWPVARSVRPLTIKGIRSSSRAKHHINLVFFSLEGDERRAH